MIVHYLAHGYNEWKASLQTGQQEFEWLFTPVDGTDDSGNAPLLKSAIQRSKRFECKINNAA